MLGNLSGPTLIVILFIVLLLFGAPKLPGLAKSLGQSMRILKKEVSSDKDAGNANADADGDSNNNSSSNSNGNSQANESSENTTPNTAEKKADN